MASPDEVAALLARIASVRSPMQRMRLVARAWRQVRALSPDQRAVLADAVGLPGAERVLERLSGREVPVGEVVRALAAVSDDEPGALRSVLRSLGDDGGRRSLLERGRETLAAALVPPAPVPPEPEAGEYDAERTPGTRAEAGEDLVPPIERRPEADTAAAPALPARAPAVETSPVASVPASTRPRSRDVPADAAPSVAPPPRNPPPAADRDGEGLRAVEAIRPSWARRREVQARIVAGEIRSLEALAPYLDRIETVADRRWCTLTLVEQGGLDPDELRRLAREAPDAVVRRRAARRADATAG